MNTNLVQMGLPTGGSSVPEPVLPNGGSLSAFPVRKIETSNTTPKTPTQEHVEFDAKTSDETRLNNMREATQVMFKEVYAVSDTRFSIYKDLTGQFVTRFTNLRDGSVTYFPEPEMMQYMESRGQQPKALLSIDV